MPFRSRTESRQETLKTRSTSLGVGRLAVVLAVMVLLAACGGNDPASSDAASTPTPTSAASEPVATPTAPDAAGEGACRYVSAQEAAGLATSAVKPGVSRTIASGSITFEHCDFIFDPGNSPGVTIAVAELGAQSKTLFAQYKQSKASDSDHQSVPGVGDEAFFAGQNLYVLTGDTGLILFVGRANGSPRGPDGIADEKKLAELVIGRL